MPITTQLSTTVTTRAGSTSPNAYASMSSPPIMAPMSPAGGNLASTFLVDKNDEYNVTPSMPSLHEEYEGKSPAGSSGDEPPSFDAALLVELPGVDDFLRTLSGAQSTSTVVFDAEQCADLSSRTTTIPKRRKLHGATSKRVVDDEMRTIQGQNFAAFENNDKTGTLREEHEDDAGELRYGADALQQMMLADPQAFLDALRQLEGNAGPKTDAYTTTAAMGVENVDQAVALINALHMNAASGGNNGVPSTATASISNISSQIATPNGNVSELLNFYASFMELARLSSCVNHDLASARHGNCRLAPQMVAIDESREHTLPTTAANNGGAIDESQLAEMMSALASAGVQDNTILAEELGALLAATSGASTSYNKNDDDSSGAALPVDERESLLQAMITGLKSSSSSRDDSYRSTSVSRNVHGDTSPLKNVNSHSYPHGPCHFSPSSASSSALSSPTAGSASSSLCAIAKESIAARQATASCQSVDSGIGAVAAPLSNSYCGGTSRPEIALMMSSLLEALANANTAPAALALLAADKHMQTAFAEYLGSQSGGATPGATLTESAVSSLASATLQPKQHQLDASSSKITEDMMRVALTQALKSSEQMHLDLNDIVKLQELNRNDKVAVYGSTPTWFAPVAHSTPQQTQESRRAHTADKLSTLYGQDENYGVLTLNRNSNSQQANGSLKNGSPTLASVLDERKRKRPRTTSKTTSNGGAPTSTTTPFSGVIGVSGGSPVLKNVLAAAASSIKNVSSALSNAKLSNAVDANCGGGDDRVNNNNNNDNSSVAAAAAAAAAAALAGNAIGCTGAEFLELSELEEFANFFKKQRIKHGFTQGDVGIALGKRYGTDFSQTTISRFEALNLSYKNMCKLRPLLKEWLEEAEMMIENGATVVDILEAPTPNFAALATAGGGGGAHSCSSSEANSNEWTVDGDAQRSRGGNGGCGGNGALLNSLTTPRLIGSSIIPPLKRRRKRTNLDNAQKAALDVHFGANPRPNHQRMNEIAALLELDPDVVRVWFCNRRQKLRKVC